MWPNSNPFTGNGQIPNGLSPEEFNNFQAMSPFGNGPTTSLSQPAFPSMPQAIFPPNNQAHYENGNGEDLQTTPGLF
jgi:hypothetical protein